MLFTFTKQKLNKKSKKFDLAFNTTQQARSQKTLSDIIEAAHHIVEMADIELFTGRVLAKRAGYSLGTLSKRLISIDKAFLWAITYGQKIHLKKLAEIINEFNPMLPIETLLTALVESSMAAIVKVNPKVIQFYDSRIIKLGKINKYHQFADVLVEPFLNAIERDQTKTFRHLTENELRLILRTTTIFIERPFVDLDSFAGSDEHRRIALDNLLRLLRN